MTTRYIKVTEREFELIRSEIYSAEAQAGCMDEDAAEVAYKAFDAVKKAELG
ncbi:hypothetical protein HNW13_017505 [Shewanella sp. BF02_Schw]|uniref:hypothetical protein n=1 Tax=Shewanella sp. BF02_Schw TaxID=394908 RepID=UPI00177D5CCC|nr:hypothetical protein [Shewanella sp. BF02_Schw]MBO1897536.1 hypothetical protein [Shewanella sp. BF02_Schw]